MAPSRHAAFSPPLEPLLRVFLLERDVERRLQNIGHAFLSVFYSHNFGEPFELILETPIGGKAKIEDLRSSRLQNGWGALPRLSGCGWRLRRR